MKYHVNDSCVGCGMCCGMCPGVFSMNSDGLAEAADADVNDADLNDAENAKNGCPVGAIEEQ